MIVGAVLRLPTGPETSLKLFHRLVTGGALAIAMIGCLWGGLSLVACFSLAGLASAAAVGSDRQAGKLIGVFVLVLGVGLFAVSLTTEGDWLTVEEKNTVLIGTVLAVAVGASVGLAGRLIAHLQGEGLLLLISATILLAVVLVPLTQVTPWWGIHLGLSSGEQPLWFLHHEPELRAQRVVMNDGVAGLLLATGTIIAMFMLVVSRQRRIIAIIAGGLILSAVTLLIISSAVGLENGFNSAYILSLLDSRNVFPVATAASLRIDPNTLLGPLALTAMGFALVERCGFRTTGSDNVDQNGLGEIADQTQNLAVSIMLVGVLTALWTEHLGGNVGHSPAPLALGLSILVGLGRFYTQRFRRDSWIGGAILIILALCVQWLSSDFVSIPPEILMP